MLAVETPARVMLPEARVRRRPRRTGGPGRSRLDHGGDGQRPADREPAGTVALRPRFDDLVGPKIALLGAFADGQWMCWRPGAESFEHLD